MLYCMVLLDEVNLAPPEVLQRLAGVLEGHGLVMAELGEVDAPEEESEAAAGAHDSDMNIDTGSDPELDLEEDCMGRARFRIARHPNFRLIACMNPSTDVGKRDMPVQLRSRFTELMAHDVTDRIDLESVASSLLHGTISPAELGETCSRVVSLYLALKESAHEGALTNAEGTAAGSSAKPTVNLRMLCRSLEYTAGMSRTCGTRRALLDGLCMMFFTSLSLDSQRRFYDLVAEHLFPDFAGEAEMSSPPSVRADLGSGMTIFHGYPVAEGPNRASEEETSRFVVTPSVSTHLAHLARAVSIRKFPVLLQGPTSSGKTSLVTYIAKRSGHTCIRINNHEHTDLSEYFGTFVAAPSEDGGAANAGSSLVFKEGPLVQAMRKGHWIILDELNLAPTDVLESLNRLLDDNRELFVPELNESIRPHPNFLLFATQNPASLGYGGRKGTYPRNNYAT